MTSAPAGPIENEGPKILGATLAVTLTALLTFVTRLYVRIRLIRNVGWDVSVSELRRRVCSLTASLGLCYGIGHVTGRYSQDSYYVSL
jgi:hypothetical protein